MSYSILSTKSLKWLAYRTKPTTANTPKAAHNPQSHAQSSIHAIGDAAVALTKFIKKDELLSNNFHALKVCKEVTEKVEQKRFAHISLSMSTHQASRLINNSLHCVLYVAREHSCRHCDLRVTLFWEKTARWHSL